MILAHSVAVARQVQTPIFSKIGTPKTARLVLPSGPLHPQGTGKHVAQSDLAQPVPYTLDTGNRLWRAHQSGSPCTLCTFEHTEHTVHTVSTLCTLCTPHPPQCLQWAYLSNHLSVCYEPKDRFNNRRYPIICADLQETRILPCNTGAYRRLIQGAIFGGPANQK